eukprot:jgi/Mesvir1/17954/Mv13000-RA.1
MLIKQHTTFTTSAVAAQLQQQTLDLREEAELAKRSLKVIVKHFDMEEAIARPAPATDVTVQLQHLAQSFTTVQGDIKVLTEASAAATAQLLHGAEESPGSPRQNYHVCRRYRQAVDHLCSTSGQVCHYRCGHPPEIRMQCSNANAIW